jgi:hypothetical protein
VPYQTVAVTWDPGNPNSQPLHETDPSHPDYFISTDNTQFDVTGKGNYEDLVLDEATGQVPHLEDPVNVGETTMEVWQYVTWYDQPNNIKRVTAVIVYKPVALSGVSRMVRLSSFFTPGTVSVSGSAAGATQGTPTTGPTVAPSVGVCSGDTSSPTGDFTILSATGSTAYTASTTVTLSLSYSDPCSPIQLSFSNDGSVYALWLTYDPNNPTVGWTLTSGDGTKSVWAKVRDGMLNEDTDGPRTIVLDTINPTVPGLLSKSVSCGGTNRTVTLNWGTSTDINFQGYRVYVSLNSAAWTVLGTTSLSTYTDSHSKTLDSVRYYVVGYDKAGNESNATNTVSLSKNQCS